MRQVCTSTSLPHLPWVLHLVNLDHSVPVHKRHQHRMPIVINGLREGRQRREAASAAHVIWFAQGAPNKRHQYKTQACCDCSTKRRKGRWRWGALEPKGIKNFAVVAKRDGEAHTKAK